MHINDLTESELEELQDMPLNVKQVYVVSLLFTDLRLALKNNRTTKFVLTKYKKKFPDLESALERAYLANVEVGFADQEELFIRSQINNKQKEEYFNEVARTEGALMADIEYYVNQKFEEETRKKLIGYNDPLDLEDWMVYQIFKNGNNNNS